MVLLPDIGGDFLFSLMTKPAAAGGGGGGGVAVQHKPGGARGPRRSPLRRAAAGRPGDSRLSHIAAPRPPRTPPAVTPPRPPAAAGRGRARQPPSPSRSIASVQPRCTLPGPTDVLVHHTPRSGARPSTEPC